MDFGQVRLDNQTHLKCSRLGDAKRGPGRRWPRAGFYRRGPANPPSPPQSQPASSGNPGNQSVDNRPKLPLYSQLDAARAGVIQW